MFIVMYHSSLIGAALFVPLPLLDETLATFLWRHIVADLARATKGTLRRIKSCPFIRVPIGVLGGLPAPSLVGLQGFFQEIFSFLERRKAINLATDAYYSGLLLNELSAYEGFDPAKSGQYAIAMQKAKPGVNMKLVQSIFRTQFRSSKSGFLSVVKWLSSITVGYAKASWPRRRNKKNAENVSQRQCDGFFEMHKSRFQELLKDLIASLQSGIDGLPKGHFDDLRNKLLEELRKLETATE